MKCLLTMFFISLFFSYPHLVAMKKNPDAVISWKEVFTDEKLRKEYEAKKFLLLEGVIKKETSHVEKILSTSHPKVALALANQLHQNITYSRYDATQNSDSSLAPLHRTINPFFKNLSSDNERSDLDCSTPVILATFLNDANMLAILLRYKANINAAYGLCGHAPLHIAAKYRPEIIQFLCQHGADVECRTARGTPLMIACQREGKLEAIAPLLNAGASMTAKSMHPISLFSGENISLSPLHIACNNRQDDKVRLLLQRGAPINEPDPQGRTPLHWSAMNMNTQTIEILLENGADVTRVSADGKTVIEHMPIKEYSDALDLLRYGAPYPQSQNHQRLIEQELSGRYFPHSNFLRAFIRFLVKGNTQEAEQLIAGAAGNTLNEKDIHAMAALHWAISRDNLVILRALLAKRQQTTAQSIGSMIPFVSAYVAQPVNINVADDKNRTPLAWAQFLRRNACVQALQEAGAQ